MIGLLYQVASCDVSMAAAESNQQYKLWYEQQAWNWESHALPLGNGPMGCMIFGAVDKERLQFNVDSLWTGDENMVGKGPKNGQDDSYLAPGMGFYQNFGNVYITVSGKGQTTNYRRELDFARAVHTVTYTRNGVRFSRETICSRPANVIIMRLMADVPGSYSGNISLVDAHKAITQVDGNRLTATGVLTNGMQYEAQLKVIADGGEITSREGSLQFTNCNSLFLVLAAETDYVLDYAKHWKGDHPHKVVTKRVDAVSVGDYAGILEKNIADYQSLFNRVEINLGKPDPAKSALPTDKRLEARRKGAVDHELTALLFQYGRYLMISCSRPGSLPANLQGLWNDSNEPAWHCDYHNNINVQMNYWMAEPANLNECHLPLFDLCSAAVPLWRKATIMRCGEVRGFTAQTVNNIFGGCGWQWNMVGSAWIAQHYWEHYAFTLDKEYLRKTAYPFMRDVCNFWEDRLKKQPDGSLVVPDGWSPEHGPREPGVSFDQEIVWDLFKNTIEATAALDIEPEFRARLADMHKRLVVPKVGKWGQLQEWMTDRDKQEDDHRHTSHLFAVYPGRQITPDSTPDLAKGAAVSLEARGETGDARRSWTWPWRCAIWARLGNAEKASHMIDGLFQYNLLNNMFTTHAPFQIDGNFGIVAGMCEMFLQSHTGTIQLLPALPSAWPTGSISGLRARGGFEVSMEWKDGELVSATVKSVGGTNCRVAYGKAVKELKIKQGRSAIVKF